MSECEIVAIAVPLHPDMASSPMTAKATCATHGVDIICPSGLCIVGQMEKLERRLEQVESGTSNSNWTKLVGWSDFPGYAPLSGPKPGNNS